MSAARSLPEALLCACTGPRALIPPGSSVLLAVSGGADSVALAAGLGALAREDPGLGLRLVVGHVDHGLRPEAAAEAGAVRALAGALGLPFLLSKLDPDRLRALAAGEGLEAAARRLRYPALLELARAAGCGLAATAHTRRDQAETVLLRLARGGGLGALAGVRASRLERGVRLVRPLLGVPREATEAFCRERGLAFTDDPHNRDPARARARLRLGFEGLSGLLNPRLEEALASAAAVAAAEDDLLERLAARALDGARAPPDEGLLALAGPLLAGALDPARLRAEDPALQRRALHRAAREAGAHPERGHVEALLALATDGAGAVDLPGGVRAAVRAGLLGFFRAPPRPTAAPPEVAVPGPGRYAWQGLLLDVGGADAPAGRGSALVDAARAPFPWTLRGVRPGDRFRPAGGRTKKVAEHWIDAKVPREARPWLPLLADATGALFWVGGLRPGAPAAPPRASPVLLCFSAAPAASE